MNTEITNESIEHENTKVLLDDSSESKITFTDKIIFTNGKSKAEISVVSEGGGKYKSRLDIANTNNVNTGELNGSLMNLSKETFKRMMIATDATGIV